MTPFKNICPAPILIPMNPHPPLAHRRILLIIAGSIAAYKSLDLIRRLREAGADVRCILTRGGAQFITPLSVAALSENHVYTDLFSLTDEQEMGHIRLARDCDLVLVAPASANLMARFAHGLADDLAATVLLATDKPVLLAPAMNPVMWQNQATQENLATLIRRGVKIITPESGDMACGETGAGRLPEIAEIVTRVIDFFTAHKPLTGKTALVTSGPTHEPLDPVRFLGNRSSGKQGHALAAELAKAGASVTLVSGPVSEAPPAGVSVISVETADQMLNACLTAIPADIAICAAAVADFRPETATDSKIKKNGDAALHLTLVPNPDILATLARHPQRPGLLIGFAAETNNHLENAHRKLAAKGCDWLLLNDVSGGKVFGKDTNRLTLFRQTPTGTSQTDIPPQSKIDLARHIVAAIIKEYATHDHPA